MADPNTYSNTDPTPRKARRRWPWIALALATLIVISTVAAGPIMSRVEQPAYTVVTSEGPVEVRAYGSMIAAQALVTGERQPAIGEGFRLIAGYIFGANAPKAKIAMTAPVLQQSQQPVDLTTTTAQQTATGSWAVRFIMPSSWTLDTLPPPTDPRVTLVPVAPHKMAVIRFSGTSSQANLAAQTDTLRGYIAAHQLKTVGQPMLAFYNPPWTLPFFRRNEIMLELAE